MKNGKKDCAFLNGLCPELCVETVRRIAFETGFAQRSWKKISPEDFLVHLCVESIKGTVSYNDLAQKIATEENQDASKQAYHNRTNNKSVLFFKRILEEIMKLKFNMDEFTDLKLASKYNRILIQDSTVIGLPSKLFKVFSGVKNGHGAVCNARIQGVYDLIAGEFVFFSIDPYSKNDLAASLDLPLRQGNLVLRDRGYFTFDAIAKTIESGADMISRYKHKTIFTDPETDKEIDLLELLRGKKKIDMKVFIGKEKIPVRLIAVPVNEETANLRRMKAKNEAKKRYAVSKENLELMSWTIFITTIDDLEFTFENIFVLYSYRWRIEIIFKAWKSHFNFDEIHNVSEGQLNLILYARMIVICAIFYQGYNQFKNLIFKKSNKDVSLLKFVRYVVRNFESFLANIKERRRKNKLIAIIEKYCVYDTRTRQNFNQILRDNSLFINDLHELT